MLLYKATCLRSTSKSFFVSNSLHNKQQSTWSLYNLTPWYRDTIAFSDVYRKNWCWSSLQQEITSASIPWLSLRWRISNPLFWIYFLIYPILYYIIFIVILLIKGCCQSFDFLNKIRSYWTTLTKIYNIIRLLIPFPSFNKSYKNFTQNFLYSIFWWPTI